MKQQANFFIKNRKPCPVCSLTDRLFMDRTDFWSNKKSGDYFVFCARCDIRTFPHQTQQEALNHWNNLSKDSDIMKKKTTPNKYQIKAKIEDLLVRLYVEEQTIIETKAKNGGV